MRFVRVGRRLRTPPHNRAERVTGRSHILSAPNPPGDGQDDSLGFLESPRGIPPRRLVKSCRAASGGRARTHGLKKGGAARVNRLDLFRRDINHVPILVLCHLTQELLKLPTAIPAHLALKLIERLADRLWLGE